MQTFDHPLGIIKVPDAHDSLDELYRLRQTRERWNADTETTGKNIYLPGYDVRLVQLGTKNEAWVLHPYCHMQAIHDLTPGATWHNKPFDALSMEVAFGIDYHVTAKDAADSEIMSRLLDPRGKDKGGLGHKLEDLADAYIIKGGFKKDARANMVEAGRKYKIKAADIWRDIPDWDPAYLYYAGQDVLLTGHYADYAAAQIHSRNLERFEVFETVLADTVVEMQRQGTLVDKDWANSNLDYFNQKAADYDKRLIEHWGIVQTASYAHTSKKSMMQRFEDMGVRWTKFSEKTKAPSLDREVLQTFAKGNNEIGELARDILEAKRNKHYADYLIGVLTFAGTDGRIHPNIAPLRAATARMSISAPPIQQWPSHDPDASKRIRGALVADNGHTILSADLRQVEFRVYAAVAGDTKMKEAIKANDRDPDNYPDLHEYTARILYPQYWDYRNSSDKEKKTQAKLWRSLVKPAGFGRLYRGGPKTIAAQAEMMGMDIPPALIRKSINAFDRAWPRSVEWGKKTIAAAEENPVIYTATGRPLIVDRAFAAVNYLIQSPARDIFANGILKIHDAGIGQYLRLVVHDEVVLSIPEDQKEEITREVQKAMETNFKGVPILSDAEIKGKHWAK